jgi:hypothetical protein
VEAIGVETSRLPHFLYNRLIDGGDAVSLMRRLPSTPRKIPDTHFCQRLSRSQGHSVAGKVTLTEKSNDLIRNQTRDLLACSISAPINYATACPLLRLMIRFLTHVAAKRFESYI